MQEELKTILLLILDEIDTLHHQAETPLLDKNTWQIQRLINELSTTGSKEAHEQER